MHKITVDMPRPTLGDKIGAAFFVAVHGSENTGIRTLAQLMWPYKEFSNANCNREAARLLRDACIALLKELPPLAIEQILKDQDEHLSFAL